VVSALSNLVSLLSSASSQQQLGQPIIRLLLSPQWSQRLNTYISGSHSELVLVTLKLWNSLSNFGAGSERKAVLDAFAWESKVSIRPHNSSSKEAQECFKALPKLLFMRRKGRAVDTSNPLTKPGTSRRLLISTSINLERVADIRTLYMFFVLSFVNASTPSSVKTGFVERHGDPLRSVFKGLAQDPYAVVRQVLERCWTGLWSDVKVKRTLKIQVFNEATIAHVGFFGGSYELYHLLCSLQIVKLYGRNEAEDDEVDHIPADVAHHFLVAICTRPGSGVCFRDRGWYPRLSEEDEAAQAEDDDVETTKQDSGRIYNKILANVLRGLKPNEDARQQELVLKILCACPELVSRFWSGAGLTMEPRLSSRWLTNISLFGAIVSLPVPSDGFLVPGSTSQYQISPPPLSTLLENVLPSVGIKMHLTKGIQSTAAMVQHASTLALVKCLQKLDETLRAFKVVEAAIEETEGTGRWSTRRRELELEARRRVPDFQVILAFVQHSQKINANRTKLDMLSEAGQRLLWLYHVLLPGLVAENKFDAGKLLQQFAGDSHDISAELAEATDVHRGLETMRRLHALRLLGEADQVIISGKASSSIRTNMFVLLKQYIVANDNAIRSGLSSLIRRQLSDTLLFQHQPEEVDIWLSALDFAIQLPLPEIHDEVDDLLAFLDDCIQRCFKTPYRYLDEWDQLLVDTPNASAVGKVQFSPLLLTFLEQLHAKVAGSHLSLSSLVRIACFFRELVFSLATASFDITPLDECVRRAEKTMNGLDSSSAVIAPAQAEIAALVVSMNSLRTGPEKHPVKPEFWDPSTKTLTFGNLTIRYACSFIFGARLW
jgi:nucleolar pre-ribosomal-associated protein 1